MTEITAEWMFQGFPMVRLENPSVRVEVLPTLGGKIWSLEHRPSARQFLWHNPRQRLRPLPLGASYDDHFIGGFDELLPNDMPERANGDALVDHGELWTTALQTRVEEDRVVLTGRLPITPVDYRKTLRLVGNTLFLEYALTNLGRRPLDLLWKLHPALRISPGAEIVVPAARARVADRQWSRVKDREEFAWSSMPALHRVPAMGDGSEFLYLLDLTRGECALQHRDENWRFGMTFSKELFSSVWIFASFGGWRELEMLILEPCTTPQLSLVESAALGQCLRLEPGQTVQPVVTVDVGYAQGATS
jgi:hypothetical protein